MNVQVFCGKIPKVYIRECAGVLREDPEGLLVNVQVFGGKIPKVYVRKCSGVLREDPEGLHA